MKLISLFANYSVYIARKPGALDISDVRKAVKNQYNSREQREPVKGIRRHVNNTDDKHCGVES